MMDTRGAQTSEARKSSGSRLAGLVVLIVGLVAAQLTGCASVQRGAADIALPPSDEEALGEQMERRVACDPSFKLYKGKQVRDYVKELGRQAVKAAGGETPKGIKYEFHVIDDPKTVNAFAMPGGEIYFYTGLLLEAKTASEVMGVMAHEVAHVTERHIAERLVTAYGLDLLASAALGRNPGTVARLVATIGAQGALLTYSRSQEAEADDTGLKYMIEAGWNPEGFVSFFETLQAKGAGRVPTLLSSHPHPKDRIRAIRRQIKGMDISGMEVGRERHQAILEVLNSGNDPRDPSFEMPDCSQVK